MAKIQINAEKIAQFGVIFSIMEQSDTISDFTNAYDRKTYILQKDGRLFLIY